MATMIQELEECVTEPALAAVAKAMGGWSVIEDDDVYLAAADRVSDLMMRHMEKMCESAIRDGKASDEWLRTAASTIGWLGSTGIALTQFNRGDRHLVRVAATLAQELVQTDADDVPLDELRLPFAAFAVEFEKMIPVEEDVLVWGAIVYETAERIIINIVEHSGPVGDRKTICLPCPLFKKRRTVGETLAAAFAASEDMRIEHPQMEWLVPGSEEERKSKFARYTRTLGPIINTILYMTSDGADVGVPQFGSATTKLAQHPKKAADWKARLRRIADRETIVIDIGKSLLEQVPENDADGSCLTVRFWVRGHFRNQPCGPRNMDRKRIWIRPAIKGPAGAPFIQRDYLVKDSRLA